MRGRPPPVRARLRNKPLESSHHSPARLELTHRHSAALFCFKDLVARVGYRYMGKGHRRATKWLSLLILVGCLTWLGRPLQAQTSHAPRLRKCELYRDYESLMFDGATALQ